MGGNKAVVGLCSPAVGVQRSEDSSPGVHILQHGSLFGACGGVAPRQLAELSREAVLNVQGLGIALPSLLLFQRLHLYMLSQLLLGFSTFYVYTDWLFCVVVMDSSFVVLRQLEDRVSAHANRVMKVSAVCQQCVGVICFVC